MKKLIILFISTLLCLSFCSCNLGTTDKDFLSKMEESVTYRMENSDAVTDEDRKELVNTELAYLSEFGSLEFKDENLKKICTKYIEGLNKQKASFEEEFIGDQQMRWQEGMVLRFQALSELYKNYDFMKDNKEFIASYISKLEEEEKILKAMQEIEKDLQSQLDKIDCQVDTFNNTVSLTLKNNTKYTYSTEFEASIYDKNKNLIEQVTDYKENIKPNTKFKITFYSSDIKKMYSFDANGYTYDIKFNK